jgi:hypothetical protein
MGRVQLEELEKHGYYVSVPKGVSMWPMIRNRQDAVVISVPDRPIRRYDVVMYIRGEEQGVIHRVLQVRDEDYIIAGDNCWQKEYVKHDQVKGIAVRFSRNGKWHEVDEPLYLLYVHIWTDLFFIRRPLFYLRDRLKRLLRKTNVRE